VIYRFDPEDARMQALGEPGSFASAYQMACSAIDRAEKSNMPSNTKLAPAAYWERNSSQATGRASKRKPQ